MIADPFGAAELRDAALAAWTRHPVRFREDANTEEDHARGYYRDRVVVELAQNAADAAARAGRAGHLSLRLLTVDHSGLLVAANTGAALDAAGVASLASLRASAKRDHSRSVPVGRFGVGFAAVRSVADEVTVASRSGAVHFSLAGATAALAQPGRDVPELGAEVARRGRWLPVLRLPFAGPAAEHTEHLSGPGHPAGPEPAPGEGWDTVVVLSLRDAEAVAQVRAQLALDDTLLLALPALSRVTVQIDDAGPQVIQDVADRWVVASSAGILDATLLADRPVEERDRTGWQVTWAVHRDGGAGGAAVVHAPTPTEEPCTLPALLIGTFPLDATRRHVASGALTDGLVAEAGRTWADLLIRCTRDQPAPRPLDLLPTGLPAGNLDADLRAAALAATRTTPVLTPAGGGPLRAPEGSVVLTGPAGGDPDVVALLGTWWPGLVETPPRAAVRMLEIPTADLTELVEGLPSLSPDQARTLYGAFAHADSAVLGELATLPVPLVDGRTVRGARGLVLVEPGVVGEDVLATLGRWGVRIVHPDAAHPLLERLGAERGDAAGLLRHPVLAARVARDADPDDDAPDDDALDDDRYDDDGHDDALGGARDDDSLGSAPDAGRRLSPAEVALLLVEATLRSGTPHPEPWWGDVLLPAHDGELLPARGLTLPGTDAAAWLDPEILPPADPALVERWGTDVLEALGVRTAVRVLSDANPGDELDAWDEYREEVLGDGDGVDYPADVDYPDDADDALLTVADLDAVRPEAWGEVLHALATGPGRRALAPVQLRTAASVRTVPAYATWWLRRRADLGLGAPFALAGAAAHELSAALRPAPALVAGLDPEAQRWLGAVSGPEQLDPDGWADLLGGFQLGPIPLAVAVAAWRGIAEHVGGGVAGWERVTGLPALVAGDAAAVVLAEQVAVGTPMWAQHPAARPLLVVPGPAVAGVADALDLDRADGRTPGRVTSRGQTAPTSDAVRAVFPGVPATWVEHEDLRVDDEPVDWWVTDGDAPVVHAATTAGLARGLAAVIGPQHAARVGLLLADPGAVAGVLLDLAGDAAGAGGQH